MSRRTCQTRIHTGAPWAAALFALAVGCCRWATAGDLLAGRFYAVPEQPFVNQPFAVHFEVEVTAGGEITDLRISDFPNNPDIVSIGQLESNSRNRITRDGQAIDVLHFTAQARGLKPISQTFNPSLQCMFVERRSSGFFSHWQSYQRQRALAPFTLSVRPLPEDGRPPEFSGAVGVFRLSGQLSPTIVRVGDIVTLHLDLTGQGWLNQAPLPCLGGSGAFKFYPPKETTREPLHVAADQVLIPTSTNAAEVSALRFVFFNPNTSRYEETSTGPFRLTFTTESSPQTGAVRVINTASSPAAQAVKSELTADPSAVVVRQVRPLVAVCLTAAVGLWLLFTLFTRHRLAAVLACLAVFVLGAFATRAVIGQASSASLTLAESADVRFAPSPTAKRLFSLNAGTAVTPVERVAGWVRIDVQGRRGWVPSELVSPSIATARAPQRERHPERP